jgi:repressor LexA
VEEARISLKKILNPDAAFVPLLGRIAAGGPILAEESIETVYPLPR